MRLIILFALQVLRARADSTCQSVTWDSDTELGVVRRDDNSTTATPQSGNTLSMIRKKDLSPGDIHCRYATLTGSDVNYYTCTQLMEKYEITDDLFFMLNPSVSRDCSNIRPDSAYCVKGCKYTLTVCPFKGTPPLKC